VLAAFERAIRAADQDVRQRGVGALLLATAAYTAFEGWRAI
jgi:hypothetical protein